MSAICLCLYPYQQCDLHAYLPNSMYGPELQESFLSAQSGNIFWNRKHISSTRSTEERHQCEGHRLARCRETSPAFHLCCSSGLPHTPSSASSTPPPPFPYSAILTCWISCPAFFPRTPSVFIGFFKGWVGTSLNKNRTISLAFAVHEITSR